MNNSVNNKSDYVQKIFGTDGVRGQSNRYPMTAEVALKLGMAASLYFHGKNVSCTGKVVIGKDPRLSGYLFEASVAAGLLAMGMEVIYLGPMPTPGVAFLTKSMRADFGVMISASHNPHFDNGIKFFDKDGYKLSHEDESNIEILMSKDLEKDLVAPEKIGRAFRLEGVDGRYIEYLKNNFPNNLMLNNLKIVLDTANGASYKVAPTLFYELGGENLIKIGDKPDGLNINLNCGSTYIHETVSKVLENGADIGIALDGDADRLILVDEKGKVLDGDIILAIIATNWLKTGKLKEKKVVATLMSNMGLEKYLNSLGIELVRVPVGDKNIIEYLRKNNLTLGAEQSGHIVIGNYNTTGDGLLAAIEVLRIMLEENKPLSKLSNIFAQMPQELINIKVNNLEVLEDKEIKSLIKEKEDKLKEKGRILVRKSGTEPLIRLLVEGDDAKEIKEIAKVIKDSIIMASNKYIEE